MSKRISDLYGVHNIDRHGCPFREFRDNELSADFWGSGPLTLGMSHVVSKTKHVPDNIWVDEQVQPLTRSMRKHLYGWVRAEELASSRWGSEVAVIEVNDKEMSARDVQLNHAQVISRSAFCRRVLSACYMLERADTFTVEHQWEQFNFNVGPEGWRAQYHIYSPGMKPGGGQHHRPSLSKNGCYLVRLFYLGAWRCVWVSDQVPVDATDSPLLPFSPLTTEPPPAAKQAADTSRVVHLWPLLICKALLKLAAPDMSSHSEEAEDEAMPEFDILHCLTGALKIIYKGLDIDSTWERLSAEVPIFSWDADDKASTSSIKSKKKVVTKETAVLRRFPMTYIFIKDTKSFAPYYLQGITPGQDMELLVTMVRDLPLKKPLPEPEVPLWKTYRWVEWARRHGLYEEYCCPRTKYLNVGGLLELSRAPYLLDIASSDSLKNSLRNPEYMKGDAEKKSKKSVKHGSTPPSVAATQHAKEEQRDWIPYELTHPLIMQTDILHFPSAYNYTSVASDPPIRFTKAAPNRAIDIVPLKTEPLYLQIDGPEENILRISLQSLHPRILLNCGRPVHDYIEPSYLLLEVFEWFDEYELPVTKAYIETRGYGSAEVKFKPGRHICRLWIHSRLQFHIMLLSTSTLLLGRRDLILSAAVKECPWAARFLVNIGTAFATWIRINRSSTNLANNSDFYKSYQPDLEWDSEIFGYKKKSLDWMFKQALQSLLLKRLTTVDYRNVCTVLRKLFYDPEFGLPPKHIPPISLRYILKMDPCNCIAEEIEQQQGDEEIELQLEEEAEEKYSINSDTINELLSNPDPLEASNLCQFSTSRPLCCILKAKRERIVRKHEAATLIQASWRGAWARKCLKNHVLVTSDIIKCLMDNAFGNIEVLSELMNEFFVLYPGAKSAYSVATALTGTNSLQQYTGTVSVTPNCKWIPNFQGVFYCHNPVKVHFDLKCQLRSIVDVYDNDTESQMLQTYNSAHVTYDFKPNERGYTVLSYMKLNQPLDVYSDVHWQLTVLASQPDAFHVCDNDLHKCKNLPLLSASKFHSDEIFVPNRRNILCGMQVAVTKPEVIMFRAVATCPELKMEAVLRTTIEDQVLDVGRCSGTGEVFWSYIRLKPSESKQARKISTSYISLPAAVTAKQKHPSAKSRSASKIRDLKSQREIEPTLFTIEVRAPDGWPLTIEQWMRVDECRNAQESHKAEGSVKKQIKEKGNQSGQSKDKDKNSRSAYQPRAGDAYVELECSRAGVMVRRDDEREQQFFDERRKWRELDTGRNIKCAQVREEFRKEYLEPPPSESVQTIYEAEKDVKADEEKMEVLNKNEENVYMTMPDKLKDKFIPLYFVPLCTKKTSEVGSIVLTPEMLEEAKKDRHEQIERAMERMRELQAYNEEHVLGRQKIRCLMLEKYFTDSSWSPELVQAFEARDEVIAAEGVSRTSTAKKKEAVIEKKK